MRQAWSPTKSAVCIILGAVGQIPLARSTLADRIGRLGVGLQPLADRLAELLRQHAYLHADEAPVRLLDPGSGKTRHALLQRKRKASAVFTSTTPASMI